MKKYVLSKCDDSAFFFQIEENEMDNADGKSYFFYRGEKKKLSIRHERIFGLLISGRSFTREELFADLVEQGLYDEEENSVENVSDVIGRMKKYLPDGMLQVNPYRLSWDIKSVRGMFTNDAINMIHEAITDSITSLYDAIDELAGKEF